MAISNPADFEPQIVSTCDSAHGSDNKRHNTGNGRNCEYGVDSEKYSTNTLESEVTITGGS